MACPLRTPLVVVTETKKFQTKNALEVVSESTEIAYTWV